jgi:hypothetical protein
MIEVFKTDVKDYDHANMLVHQIHTAFSDYSANFDLQDCDNILRVKSTSSESIESECLINLLKNFGFHAEVLPDNCVDHNVLAKTFLRLIG